MSSTITAALPSRVGNRGRRLRDLESEPAADPSRSPLLSESVLSDLMLSETMLSDTMLAEVRDVLAEDGAGSEVSAPGVAAVISGSGRVFGSETIQQLTMAARAELSGAGPLQPWLDLEGVTDVLVNNYHEVWVERFGKLERIPVNLGSDGGLRAFAVRLAALAGQRLDDAAPICDGTLPDGTRLHAVLPPLTAQGAVISLRVHHAAQFDLPELVERGMVPPAWANLLRALVERRANIIISGGTGTGKTTLLAALLAEVEAGQRVITVEEARELAPPVPHHVPLVARRANVEGAGEVTLADLVRAALRMRPDRLILGECRAGEVREVLQAMNTGHDGGMATLHANSAAAVPARLEALGALAGMTREAIAAQATGAIDVVLQLRRHNGIRYISEIGIPHLSNGELAVAVIAGWNGVNEPEVLSLPNTPGPTWAAFGERWLK